MEQTDPREASIRFDVEVGLEALTLELSGPEDGTNLVEGGRVHANGTIGAVTVSVKANRPVTEDVTVRLLADRALSDADADDFAADPIVIEAGETTGSTVVTAVEDETAEKMGRAGGCSAWPPGMPARSRAKSGFASGTPRCRPCRSSRSSCWRRSWPSAATAGTGGGSVRRTFATLLGPFSPDAPGGRGFLFGVEAWPRGSDGDHRDGAGYGGGHGGDRYLSWPGMAFDLADINFLEEDRPGTAARLLAALEAAADDPVEGYSARVTEKMQSMLGCIQEFLLDIGNFTSPRIARIKW